METFRQFDAVDVFGSTWHVLFKWVQTAISLRHSDTVDVKFILTAEDGTVAAKTIAMQHVDLLKLSAELGYELSDAWCCRLAARHLLQIVSTGEDLEINLITVPYEDLRVHGRAISEEEQAEVRRRGAA